MVELDAPGLPTLRLFIGIACPPSTSISALLNELQNAALEGHSGIRVVPENNLHITLKFLGPVGSNTIRAIAGALDQTAFEARPFEITFAGTGAFKDAFWLGIRPCISLDVLVINLSKRLELLGFSAEKRPLIPHLTVARIDERSGLDTESLILKCSDVVWGSLNVRRIHLYQSRTLSTGVTYSMLHTAEFPWLPNASLHPEA